MTDDGRRLLGIQTEEQFIDNWLRENTHYKLLKHFPWLPESVGKIAAHEITGRVVKFFHNGKLLDPPLIQEPYTDYTGRKHYQRISIPGGSVYLHHLILCCLKSVPDDYSKVQCRWIDKNTLNNNPDNLEWKKKEVYKFPGTQEKKPKGVRLPCIQDFKLI